MRAVDNDEYGIFPSHTLRGRLDHSFASGANDTGHYIGQSSHARVDHNVARGNVSGFELENSSHIRADHNLATGNTGGILSFTLPNLDVKSNSDNRIDHNVVRGNNKANTCIDPDDAVCDVPSGTGILLVAADRNHVVANRVGGNNSFGIAVSNYCVATGITARPSATRSTSSRTRTGTGSRTTASRATERPPTRRCRRSSRSTWPGTRWAATTAGRATRRGTTFPSTLPACS